MMEPVPVAKAKKALEIAWNGKLPVRPEEIAQKLVITWSREETTTKHPIRILGKKNAELDGDSGYAEYDESAEGKPFVCVYNVDEIPTRGRFTMAHELGHVLLGHVRPGTKPKRDNNFNAYGDWDEVDANSFAAELLMPETYVRRAVEQGLGISELAEKFDVSPTAMRYRLQKLGLVTYRVEEFA